MDIKGDPEFKRAEQDPDRPSMRQEYQWHNGNLFCQMDSIIVTEEIVELLEMEEQEINDLPMQWKKETRLQNKSLECWAKKTSYRLGFQSFRPNIQGEPANENHSTCTKITHKPYTFLVWGWKKLAPNFFFVKGCNGRLVIWFLNGLCQYVSVYWCGCARFVNWSMNFMHLFHGIHFKHSLDGTVNASSCRTLAQHSDLWVFWKVDKWSCISGQTLMTTNPPSHKQKPKRACVTWPNLLLARPVLQESAPLNHISKFFKHCLEPLAVTTSHKKQ